MTSKKSSVFIGLVVSSFFATLLYLLVGSFDAHPKVLCSSKELLEELQQSSNENVRTNLTKVIMMDTRMDGEFQNNNLVGCEISNCIFRFTDVLGDARQADVVITEFNSGNIDKLSDNYLNKNQLLFVFSHESSAYSHHRWPPSANVKVNGTMSYRQTSAAYYAWGNVVPHGDMVSSPLIIPLKDKGAFAYVSNCYSRNYDRLGLMKQLSRYIDVDVFGKCTGSMPCAPQNYTACETQVHSKYRFYLAFENSLCKEYITEKFWKTLDSPNHLVPVVMGGLSVEEYTRVAPSHSFIHVDSFATVEKLGNYLRYLSEDDEAYKQYHQWKSKYRIVMNQNRAACDLCKLAHNHSLLNSFEREGFADEWNNEKSCRDK